MEQQLFIALNNLNILYNHDKSGAFPMDMYYIGSIENQVKLAIEKYEAKNPNWKEKLNESL